jgi:glutaredoxin
MLKAAGVDFDDRILSTREETDAFQEEHNVSTTPQLFVEGERIGGTEEIERWLAAVAAA